ncbi:hypothetical protein RG959_15435 [Domibacillus sp. 8LH]|uniref:hypothetical protein n=1 Tax=Domibacillus sp. 8LH TaxID=3073900 RepID=UPI00317AA394
MDVGVAYFPKHYFSNKPDAGGHFPFAIEGTANYVFDIDNFYLPECDENFVLLWMKNIKAYPIYFCAEILSSWKQDYEKDCEEANVYYKYLYQSPQLTVAITEIQNEKQFQEIFPWFITMGTANEIVVWSANKDVFSVEQREWTGNWEGKITETIVVEVDQDTSIFWIGYDGTSIAVLSNNPQFSTYEKICETLPDFISPTQYEYQ